MIIVADASAVAAFLIPDEAGEFADLARKACGTHNMYAPQHWVVELANIVWKAHRRGRVSDTQLPRISEAVAALVSVATIYREADITDLISFAVQTGLTSYDASYLLLAQTLSAPLLTRDGALARAASIASIQVYGS